jgi:hypothetical protein
LIGLTAVLVIDALNACRRLTSNVRTRAAADLPSAGGRSEPGDTLRSRKLAGPIHRREFGLRDP